MSVIPKIDFISSIIMREKKQGKPRIAACYCKGCPIKQEHQADFDFVDEKHMDIPVCQFGLDYHLEKACRKLS